jgi:hypothetical protein
MMTSSLPFIKNDWTISLTDLPTYPEFKNEFIEPLDLHILKMFMDTNNQNITPIMKQEIENKLIKNINHKNGHLSVRHHQTYGLGRFYPNENISLIPYSKYIKHTIFKYLGWRDLDMVKGHMTISREMGGSVGLTFNAINRYIDNFAEVCDETREFYQLDENDNALTDDDIKWLFCVMMYGGGLKCWVDGLSNGDEKAGYKPKQVKNSEIYSLFAREFKSETKQIINRIYTKNPSLVRKLKKPNDELYETKGRVASYWFQTIENHILYIVYGHLIEQGIIKPSVCGLEYDGLCLPPFLKSVDEHQLIQDINTIIRLKTGLNIKMKFKDYGPAFVLDEIIEQRQAFIPPVINTDETVSLEIDGLPELPNDAHESMRVAFESYRKWKKEFELEWCKIINSSMFVRRYKDKNNVVSYVFQKESQLVTSFKHLSITYFVPTKNGGLTEKTLSYINKWLTNPKMRNYDSIVNKPPPMVAYPNEYNTWIDSAFESQPINENDSEYDTENVELFFKHIDSLCAFEPRTTRYVKQWIAHSFQKPAEKVGVALNFSSEQGTGKGIFGDILIALAGGGSKGLITSKPEEDVWGSFNDLLVNAYFVILNETDQRNTKGFDGRVKSFITDTTIPINPKGKTPFVMDSYHRVISFSNFHESVKTDTDDRRNTLIRSSNIHKGDTAYFEKLSAIIKNKRALRSIYWAFKNLDISDFKYGVALKTDYQNTIIGLNTNPIRDFMVWFCMNNTGQITISSAEFIRSFTTWRTSEHIRFGENISSAVLIKKIVLELKPPETIYSIVKTNQSNLRMIDIEGFRELLGIQQD